MSRLLWDQPSERDYDSGLDRGVFYPANGPAQVWNGLVSVEESPSEAEVRARYLDGRKIGNTHGRGVFHATVEAYTYPEEINSRFGFTYRVTTAFGHKIHLVYNALAAPSTRTFAYNEASTFSWDVSTRPILLDGQHHVSHIVIDTSVAYPETIAALEDVLYGSPEAEAVLPSPADVLLIFEENSILQIIDNGDGSWTAIGPDDVVYMVAADEFAINYETAVYLDAVTYTVHSL